MPQPTASSYALLGLLALRPWTAYELVGQTQRSLRFFWPRSEAHVYGEVKRLVELGWADSTAEQQGGRRRTRYTITAAGREALSDWLDTAPAPPLLEVETMLRMFFADQGSPDQLLSAVTALRDQAQALDDHGRQVMAGIAADGGPFPERLHLYLPLAECYHALLHLLVAWADRTAAEVAGWESTGARSPTPADLARLRAIVDGP